MQGCGKSSAIKPFEGIAKCFCSDAILYEAAGLAFPAKNKSERYDWNTWPLNKSQGNIRITIELDLKNFLTDAIERLDGEISKHQGHMIIEGSALANDWFRNPLIDAFVDLGLKFNETDIKLFYLSPPDEVILERIHKRAREHENRAKEAEKFKNIDAVVDHRKGFESHINFTLNNWELVADTNRLNELIKITIAK